MNNSNMPAYPTEEKLGDASVTSGGMTKREEISSKMLAALISGVNGDADLHECSREWLVETTAATIEFADELLKQLEENQNDH